jgi:hypothetical protein
MVRSSYIFTCILACIIALLAAGSAFAQNTDGPGSRAGKSAYTVDGLALGTRVDAQSPAYRGYQCSPSEQFPEFTRCQRTQRQQGAWGRRSFDSTSSILHGGDGKAVYVNHYVAPWTFDRNEIQSEINRLSSRFGERAREMRMPAHEGLPSGIIAAWGQVQLEPLDAEAISVLASGQSPRKGLLIDYLGDLRRSAQLGLPIYSLHGGAGFVWSASAERSGRGHIRFLTVDASAFSPTTENPQGATEAKTSAKTSPNTSANTSETIPVETPQPPAEIARTQPEKARLETEVPKAEVESAPATETTDSSATASEQFPAPEREKLDALFARLETQLARAEAANRAVETLAYRTIAALVLLLIVAAVLLLAWRRKSRATTARGHETETPSPIALPQASQAQCAEQSALSLVPQAPSPQGIVAGSNGKVDSPQAHASNMQPCTSCHGEISRNDKFCKSCGAVAGADSMRSCSACREEIGASDTFCRYCGASSIAVAAPSMVFSSERADAG